MAVAINRFNFYNKNQRDVVKFIRGLKTELVNGRLDAAKSLSIQLGGVIGEVAEEAVRIFSEQKQGFSRSFDISEDLASQGNQSAAVAMGIGSALIATAFGLGVAIVAVVLYNIFQSTVKRYEDDFQLIKLLFLSFTDSEEKNVEKALV